MTGTETETDQQPEEPALEFDEPEEPELSWDNMKGELETNYAEIKDNINKWKAKAMDQYLLNDDVYLYDFANRESKAGNGPFQCRMFDGNPCCIPNEIWTELDKNKDPPRPPQVMAVIKAWTDADGKNRKKIPCRDSFGLEHEYDGVLEAQCWLENDENVECEGKINFSKIRSHFLFSEKFQDWCLYDKNGAACCTKKLDLFHEWLDAGFVDQSPFVNYIELFDKHPHYWGFIQKEKWTTQVSTLYHVDGVDNEHEELHDIKTRWNFECPTHHPVPTVAIILGNSRKYSRGLLRCLFCIINDTARVIFSTIVRMFHSGHGYTACNRDCSVFPCKNSPASKRRGGCS